MINNIRNSSSTELTLLEERSSGWRYDTLKRWLDYTLSLTLLIVLAPILLVIGLLIKIDSPGPMIFTQERVGARRRLHNNRIHWEITTFPFYKFRTMYHGADQSLHEEQVKRFVQGQILLSENGGSFKIHNDPRITPLGRLLRKTSLDELPQLLNVLRGEMSLVGPRPVPTYEVAGYQPHHRERLAVWPGITGIWQVKGRGRVTFEEMITMDIEYVRQRSLWLDLTLMAKTLVVAIKGLGAR
jgi:lipopolysaccharide/colanic/teichoic acid biosynthesis glycosyltransferase